jgi:hypothetical protein
VAAQSDPSVSTLPEWSNPWRTIQEIVGSTSGLGLAAPFALTLAGALALAGILRMGRRDPLMVVIYVLQPVLALAILWLASLRIWPRYFFVDVGFAFLACAAGADALARAIGRRGPGMTSARERLVFAAIAATLTVPSLALLAGNYAHPKQDFPSAVALVEAARTPGDVATSTALAAEPLRTYYAPRWPVVQSASELEALLGSASRVWLVTAFEGHARRRRPDVMALVDQRFELVGRFPGTLGDGTVRVYRSRSGSP